MKKKAVLALALAALLALAGCAVPALPTITPPRLPRLRTPSLAELRQVGSIAELPALFTADEPAETEDTVSVYRVVTDAEEGALFRTEELVPPDDGATLDWLVSAFSAPGGDGLACALPEGVAVEGYALEQDVVTLELSPSFLALPDMRRTVAAFCAALTLCQLDEVDAVTVTAGGQTVFAGLMPEDAILSDTDTDPYVRQLRLYFPDEDGRYLVSEYHSLTLDEDTSPERYVVEELLRGPNSGELQSAMPAGTTLRSCRTEDGVCTVDLSREFYDGRPDTALGERLAVCSLVNSLTALSGVTSVRITVEGRPVDTYVFRALDGPLEWYGEAVGPISQPKGETDADLYLTLPGLAGVAPLPFRVGGTDGVSRPEAVLAALLGAEEPGYPDVLPGSGAVVDVSAQGSVCVIELSEGFFVSVPEDARELAVQSMAATVCALPDVSAVRFTIGGSAAVFDGADWSGPWRESDLTLVIR